MQLVINTYGTYLHIKDELFEVRIKKDGKVEKYHSKPFFFKTDFQKNKY